MYSIKKLYLFLNAAIFTPTSWAFTTIYWIALLGIFFLIILFFVNAKKNTTGYLVVGSILLLGVILITPSVG